MTSYSFISDLYLRVGEVEVLKNRASSTDVARARHTISCLDKVLSASNQEHTTRILEIGPGSGYITSHVTNYILQNHLKVEIDICDVSKTFLQRCGGSIRGINNFFHADICAGDSNSGLFMEKKYNIILFEEALEHTVSPFAAVFNINRLLDENGRLILTVPNTLYAPRLLRELNPFRKLESRVLDTHIAELSPLSIVKLLSMAGFDVEGISYYASAKGVAKRLTSQEVGFSCIKVQEPMDAWIELTSTILSQWSQ